MRLFICTRGRARARSGRVFSSPRGYIMMIIHLVDRKRIDAWISGRGRKEKLFAENDEKKNLRDLTSPSFGKIKVPFGVSRLRIKRSNENAERISGCFNLIAIEARRSFVQMCYVLFFFPCSRQRFSTPVNRRVAHVPSAISRRWTRSLANPAVASRKRRHASVARSPAFTELKIRAAIRFGERSKKYTTNNLLDLGWFSA